mmetsp:Transcript_21147/g.46970  ORF Transcript_21147/g.46970 Transcript_21147/m.46970 type:complete len:232 (-) Transcript_21147:8-703(-)
MYILAGLTSIVRRKSPAADRGTVSCGRPSFSRFDAYPAVSPVPRASSATPVHATWKYLLPGRYHIPHAPWAGIMFMKSSFSLKCAPPAAMNTGPSSANVLFHDSTRGKAAAAASNALTRAYVPAKRLASIPATMAAWELSGSVLIPDGEAMRQPSSPIPGSASPAVAITGPMLRLLATLTRAIGGGGNRNEATWCDASCSRSTARRTIPLIISLGGGWPQQEDGMKAADKQ